MTDIRAICNLSDEDLERRRAELRENLFPLVRGREELPDGLALLFEATPKVRQELNDFVAFERQCCPGLGFSVSDTANTLRLEIRGIDPHDGLFTGIAEARGADKKEGRNWSRLLRSAGLGATGALVLCCVVPIGLVAVLGASIAAPFVALDNPWAIGLSALLLATLLWRWERRREAARNSTGSCGC